MKVMFGFVLIIVLGLIAQLVLPWWIIAIVGFLVGLTFMDKASYAVITGFFAVFTLWGLVALLKSYQNNFVLIDRMSELLPIHNVGLLLFVTALIGGLVGLLSTLSGYYLQVINEKPKRKFK